LLWNPLPSLPSNAIVVAMVRFPFFTARRIVLVKPSALGDVVQSLPVLAALRARFPDARISWVVNVAYAPLLQPLSILDEVIPFDRVASTRTLAGGAKYFWTLMRSLRERRFDFAIDLQGLIRSGALTLATGAHRRWGLRSAREGSRFAYNYVLDDTIGSPAAVDRYWRVAEALGVAGLDKRFPLEISEAERGEARALLAGLPKPWIAVQPGARWETKRWPASAFATAMQLTIDRVGGSAIILGSRDETTIADETASRLRTPLKSLAGKTTLRILAAVLQQCDALVTNDTGPMHLAAAVGTPTASVFTCTSPRRAGPFGVGHRIVQTKVDCRESYLKTCQRMSCMTDVAPDQVVTALVRILCENLGRRRSA
jgi:heptosyltransferase-1